MSSCHLLFHTPAFNFSLKRWFLLGAATAAFFGLFSRDVRAANNPVPFVDIVSPVSIAPGSTGVTLTVRGTGFVAASTVVWNGTSLATTFVSAQELIASVPDAMVAAVGLGSVVVSSPSPGGRKSSPIYVPVAAAEVSTSFPATPTSSVGVGTMPQGLVTADFNGDGKLDLAIANNGSDTVSILLGDGHGGFTTKSTPSAGTGANWLAVGDFNEDGIPDLAVANLSSAGTAGVTILLGNGDGTFTLKSSPNTGSGPFAITAADFNGDGHLDLAVTNSNDTTVTILLGVGDGTFTGGGTLTVSTLPQVIVAGDFNEDGKLDLAVSNEGSGSVSLLLGIGDGTFQSQAVFSTAGTNFPIGLIAADFNGDGHLDVAAVNASDVAILLGNGSGSLTLKANPGTGTSDLIAGVAGDYNGDGKLDIVVSDRSAGQAFLLPGVGDGTFGTKLTFTTAAGAFGVATADFNGDGGLDLAVANGTANNVSIFLQLLPVDLNPTSLSFGDQAISTPSISQAVVLTNSSGSTLNFTSIGFTGSDSGDFSQTNTCGASITNNSTCTINVTFTPSAPGARVATLQIVDNASNSPQTLAVSGTGTASLAITSAASTTFSLDAAGTFTVTTTGSPAPTLGETGALPGSVNFTDNGNGTASIAGTPANGSAGSYILTITAHNGVDPDVMQTFTLTVLGPPSIAKSFGAASIPVGSSLSLSFTISNANTGTAFTGVSFTDSLPAGLIVDSPNNLISNCGGTATAVATSSAVSLSSGAIVASESCTVSLNVLATTVGAKSNSVTVSDTSAGTGNTSIALLTVNKADSTTAVTSSANPSVFGQPVTFTATVSAVAPGTGTATGTVTFLDGGSPIGTGTLSGGIATFTTSALAVGNHTLTTSYGGDGNFNGNTGSLTGNPQVVNKTNTTTTVTSSQNPSVSGQSVTFTATVSPVAPGTGTATGTVTFLDGGSPIGTGNLSGGIATFTTSTLTVGNHTLTTTYGGDGNCNGITGLLTGNPQVVNKADSTTAVTSSTNPSVSGQSVTFTATVSVVAPGKGAATGTVTFLNGGSPIGTGNLSGGIATFTTSALAVGNQTLTISYGGDASFNAGTGSLTGNPQVVNKTNTTTAVTSLQNPSVSGQSVTFTATVSPVAPGAGAPTGTVTFLDGGTPIGTGTLSGGIATFITSALAVGNHTITTSYGGDANFNGSTGSLTGNPQVVSKAGTTTALASSANPSVFGQPVTFTATVSPVAPGTGTATGTVTFLDGGSPIGTGNLSGGIATFTTSASAIGSHTITTSYGGDASFNGSAGSLTGNPQVVNKTSTATTATSSANPSVFGQSVTFTATVSPIAPGAGTPSGTVTFLDGGSPIGTGNLSGGIATFTTSASATGSHTITTSYSGDADFNASAGSLTGNPLVVNKANSSSAVTSSQNPSVFGQSVTFTATILAVAPGTGTPTGTVTFLDGGSPIGTGNLSGGIATFTTSALGSGNHTITTSYGGDVNFNVSAGSLTGNPQVVNKTNTATAITSAQSPSLFGQAVTFTATVTAVAPGVGTPTGTVTFFDGGSPIGSGILSGGIATFTTSALTVGNHTLTTAYGGDASFNGSAGSLTGNPQVVNKASTATAITSSQNPSIFGQSVTFTATVSPVAPGAGTPTGTVTFLDGGGFMANVILSGGMATFTTSALAVGNQTVTTTYSGDASFTGSAGSLTGNPQVVNKTATTTGVTSSQNPSIFGQPVTFTATVSPVTPGAGTPTGTVTFLDGGSSIGTGVLSAGVATFTTSALAIGNHTITTSYPGSASFNASTGALTGNLQVINKTGTTTALASSLNSAALHQSVVFTATVAAVAPGTGTPTGTVTFLDGGNSIGTGTLGGGTATFTTTILSAGNHTITASYGGDANFNTSNAALTGNPQIIVAPPVAAKMIAQAVIAPNGVTTMTFTITNPLANTVALAGVAFTDTLPAGLVVSTPNGLSNTCGGVATAAAGSTSLSLAGGSIPVNTSCSFVVNITGTVSGQYTSTSGAVTSTNGGAGNMAAANITVATPPTITKAFGAASIGLAGSTSLSFTITNPNPTLALAGVTFTDNLPAGLVISTPNALAGSCGSGVIIATAGSQIVSLSNGAIGTNSSCTLSINVTASIAGNQVNTTGAVGSANAGTGNTATASINVLAPDLTLAKSHVGNFYQGQTGAIYSLTVSNASTGATLGTVTVTDALPAGLTATAIAGTGWSCTLATLTCTRADALAAAASYPAIAVTVNVAANAAASVTNSAAVSGGGELNAANNAAADVTTVTLPPDFSMSFTLTSVSVRAGQQATYAIAVTPLNNVFTNAISFSVSGLPGKTSIVFTPSSVTPGSSPAATTLVVSTTEGDPYVARSSGRGRAPFFAMLLPLAGLLLSGFGFRGRPRKNKWFLAAALLVCGGFGIYGCVGAQTNFQYLGTPAGSYTVTVTGTSGTLQHSTPITLVVQP